MHVSNRLSDTLSQSAEAVAPRLLGSYLERTVNGQKIVGMITETEAYDQRDAASHSYRGETPRNSVMFEPAGRAYVYFTYGMHYCMNVVTGGTGHGSAVLIRALEPIAGLDIMQQNRDRKDNLANGPAKLCQALGVDKTLNGHDLSQPPLRLILKEPLQAENIVTATRIGISKGRDKLWRFYVKDSPFVSYT